MLDFVGVYPVCKIEDTKFLACPMSSITPDTWDLIRQVHRYTNKDLDFGPHLPEPDLPLHQQSPRFLKAVEIMRQERNSKWFSDLQREWAKAGKG